MRLIQRPLDGVIHPYVIPLREILLPSRVQRGRDIRGRPGAEEAMATEPNRLVNLTGTGH